MPIYSISCDYITLTAELGSEADKTIQDVFSQYVFEATLDGHEPSAARRLGYTGEECGGAFLGGRPDGRILRASGEAATFVFDRVVHSAHPGKVTRIDLQATWASTIDDEERAVHLCEQVRTWQAQSGLSNPPKVTLIQGFGKGDTLIVGSRSSEKYVRVYDKSREEKTNGPLWLWRWEAELKGDTAVNTFLWLQMHRGTALSIIQALSTYLDGRGILYPWEALEGFTEPAKVKEATSHERSLEWLRNSVRRTVRKLIQAGLRDEVNEALGMTSDE